MQRPTRIAAVIATTAVLMTTAAAGVFSIQQAAAGAGSATVVSADGPALVSTAGMQDAGSAPAALAPIGTTTLPSIDTILQSAPGAATDTTATPAETVASRSAGNEREREDNEEHEGNDD
jgi:hypothetical protein